MLFKNRKHAGKLLAEKIKDLGIKDLVILALPRGGVPVAAEIAARLNAPLDVLVVRKIGAPLNPEFAIGAMGEDKEPFLNQDVLSWLGLDPSDISGVIQEESNEIDRQLKVFRENRPKINLKGKSVLIVDDGLATGSTAKAAMEYVKKQGASKIYLSVPVAARSAAELLRKSSGGVFTLAEPEDFQAVSQWYFDFSPIEDQEVKQLLIIEQDHSYISETSVHSD